MTAARSMAAALAGGFAGIGEGMVTEAKAEREAMLERIRQAHQSSENEKNRQLTRDEGEKTRALTVSEAEKTRTHQAEQAGAQREDTRNEGVLNRAQQKTLAELQISAQKALKQMEIDADPNKALITLEDGSVHRVSRTSNGEVALTPVKTADGKPARKSVSGNWMNVGSDLKVYGDNDTIPEGVTVTRIPASTYNALIGERGKTTVAGIKADAALAIQDSKTGATLTKAQVDATVKVMVEGMKGENALARARLIREAISEDQEKALKAQAELKREGFDVQKEIAKAHDASREKIAAETNATRLQTAGAGQRAKLEGDERADYERRLKKEAEAEYDNLKPGKLRGMFGAEDRTGGVSREKWVREYVDREMAKRDGEPEQSPSAAGAGRPETGSLRTNSDRGDSGAATKKLPEGWDEARAIASAKTAIAQGKPRAEIEARLRQYGIDPAKLGQ